MAVTGFIFGAIIVGAMALSVVLVYRLAVRIEREERLVEEWDDFLRTLDPFEAQYLSGLRDAGDVQSYSLWAMRRFGW